VVNGLWGDLFPIIAFIVSAGLMIFARIKHWSPEKQPETKEEINDLPAKIDGSFLTRHRWGFLLGAVLFAIVIFLIVFSPPRLTGEIPPNPNVPGRPFYSLHWIRDFLRDNPEAIENWTNLVLGLFCLIPIGFAIKRRSTRHAELALLLSSLSIAALAQWTLGKDGLTRIGWFLYLIAILGLVYWAWLARSRLHAVFHHLPIGGRSETVLIICLLILATFARFHAIGAVPYGIEGDEAKWTSEAVNLTILGQPDSSGEYHRDALPISFYMQTPFYRFFGPSLLSARIAVAFLSLLATMAFYWFIRQIASVPLAIIATYLLAISIFDISASRLANVESFVKLWAILPFALLIFAVKKGAWQAYALAGISLAIAILTYDTLWPIPVACFIIILFELGKTPAQQKFPAIAAFLSPILLTLPIVIPYFVSRINYYELGEKGWNTQWFRTLTTNFENVLESWFVALRPDFLYNRIGPLLNSVLLPFLVAGTVISLFSLREKSTRWLLLWAGLVILPVPILANSPLGRVYYPGLPAVYGLIAICAMVLWKEIQILFAPAAKPILFAVLLVPLVWMPLMNFYIYFNEVSEPDDRQMRREISSIAETVTDEQTLLVLPVIPGADEPLNNEYQMIELHLMEHFNEEKAKQAYQRIALEDVMPSISTELMAWKKLILVLDNKTEGWKESREELREGLYHCFPEGELIKGYFFDQFIITDSARKNAKCVPASLSLEMKSLSLFSWQLSNGRTAELTFLCDKQSKNFSWVEAEELSLGPGWFVEINFAPGWSGSGFVMDTYGSQFLGYEFAPGFSEEELFVWVRTYKRTFDNSPVFINVNGTTQTFGDARKNTLNQWNWERIGPFPNDEINRMTIARPYNEDLSNFMAVFIDTFIFTTDSSFNPEGELTEVMPPIRIPLAQESTSGSFRQILESGQYSCRIQAESDGALVDSFGRIPILSNIIKLTIP
jgi:4-amino-4-deoxy-L-arabinose transferase-like glycosyltransferase